MAKTEPIKDTEESAAKITETAENTEADKESGTMEISYNVTGPAGKSLQPQ